MTHLFSQENISWFWIALFAPFFWAVAIYIDKVLIEKYLKKNTSLLTLVMIINLPLIVFTIGLGFYWQEKIMDISPPLVLFAFLGGVFLLFGLVPFFYAIQENDVSSVAPLVQLNPLYAFIFGLIFLGETITFSQMIGGLVLVGGALGLSYEHKKEKINKKPLFLMAITCSMMTLNDVIFKIIAQKTGFAQAFFWQSFWASFIMIGLLIIPFVRKNLLEVITVNPIDVSKLAFFNAGFNFLAKFIMQFSISLVPIVLATLVNSIQPVFVFFLGLILSCFYPLYIKEDISKKTLFNKGFFILVIVIGSVFFVAHI